MAELFHYISDSGGAEIDGCRLGPSCRCCSSCALLFSYSLSPLCRFFLFFFHCLLSISLSFSLLSLCVYLLFLQRGPLVLSSFLISRCYNFPFVFPASLSLSLDSYYFLYPLLLLRRVPLFYFSYVFTVLF